MFNTIAQEINVGKMCKDDNALDFLFPC